MPTIILCEENSLACYISGLPLSISFLRSSRMMMRRLFMASLAAVVAPVAWSFHPPLPHASSRGRPPLFFYKNRQAEAEPTYPESKPATYELLNQGLSFDFGPTGLVRPLLKQTQLETRKLQVAYDANKHGWDAQSFHRKVDGKGAAVVLAKVGGIGGVGGAWIGGYNPRGWASLGGSRPSIASFLFYKTTLAWQKIRVKGGGGMACGKDEYNTGIYFGADALTIPLAKPDVRQVNSRLGMFFDYGPNDKTTVLPRPGGNPKLSELYILTGVYAKGEGIPNSGGVTDLGLY